MAQSKCGHCGSTRFEIKEVEPQGSQFKLYFIQCASCGVPVSTIEYKNNTYLLEKLSVAVKNIASTLNTYVDL
jgi:predicted nucleic-acid-binding Zn-ribbon protein